MDNSAQPSILRIVMVLAMPMLPQFHFRHFKRRQDHADFHEPSEGGANRDRHSSHQIRPRNDMRNTHEMWRLQNFAATNSALEEETLENLLAAPFGTDHRMSQFLELFQA